MDDLGVPLFSETSIYNDEDNEAKDVRSCRNSSLSKKDSRGPNCSRPPSQYCWFLQDFALYRLYTESHSSIVSYQKKTTAPYEAENIDFN